MTMRHRQPSVGRVIPKRGMSRLIILLALTFTVGCSDRIERAQIEADKAAALLEAGDLAGARVAIAKAMKLKEDQLPIILLDAQIKMRAGDLIGAFDSYNLAASIDSGNSEALNGVALLGIFVGDDLRALEFADRILMIDPNNVNAKMIKGIAYINQRKFDESRKLGESILATDPSSDQGTVLLARSKFLLGERKEAIELLSKARALHPASTYVLAALMECARDAGDAQLVLEQLRALRTLSPDSVDYKIDEINVRYKQKDVAGARSAAAILLAQHGSDVEALARLSSLWREYDQRPLTAAQLEGLAANGSYQARLMVARFFLDIGDLASAAIPVRPMSDIDGRALMSRIAQASGDLAAEKAAEVILSVDKMNCDAMANRVVSLLRRRLAQQAVIDAQSISTECPDRDDGFLLLARAYMMLGKPVGVQRAFEEGISARPLEVSMSAAYARWLADSGKAERAVSVANSLTDRAPAKPSAWRLLAEMCGRAGNPDCKATAEEGEAQSWRNLAIDLPPGQRRANPLLGSRLQ